MRKNGTQVYGAEGGETDGEIYRKYIMLNTLKNSVEV